MRVCAYVCMCMCVWRMYLSLFQINTLETQLAAHTSELESRARLLQQQVQHTQDAETRVRELDTHRQTLEHEVCKLQVQHTRQTHDLQLQLTAAEKTCADLRTELQKSCDGKDLVQTQLECAKAQLMSLDAQVLQ